MKIPEIIKIAANSLRKNSTKAEIVLWEHIKNEKL
jgi:very-short-patch-repair endonuclease